MDSSVSVGISPWLRSAGRFCLATVAVWIIATFWPATGDAQERVLRRGTAVLPESLDPHYVRGNAGAAIMYDMFEGLLAISASGDVAPGLADEWARSEDGLRYTFRLRPDARWSDGSRIVADDVVWSYRRAVDPKNAAHAARVMFPIRNALEVLTGAQPVEALGVRAIDDATVEIELDTPRPYFPKMLTTFAFGIVPRAVIEKHGQRWTLPENIVTSGAYTLESVSSNTLVRLRRNEHYHDAGQVAINKVEYVPVERPETALTLYRGGELDIVLNVPVNRMDWLKERFPEDLRPEAVAGIYYILLNNTRPPFDDSRVREALSLAIDRDVIANALLNDGSQPAYSLVPPALFGYEENPLPFFDMTMDERRAKARELLQQAGYGPSRPLQFEFNFGGLEENRRLAVAFQAMWRQVGVHAEVRNRGSHSIARAAHSRDYGAMRYIYYAPYEDPISMLDLLRSDSLLNFSGYANEEYDKAFDATNYIVDPDERMIALRRVEQLAMSDHPVIPIYFKYRYYLVRPEIEGWISQPSGTHLSRYLAFGKGRTH